MRNIADIDAVLKIYADRVVADLRQEQEAFITNEPQMSRWVRIFADRIHKYDVLPKQLRIDYKTLLDHQDRMPTYNNFYKVLRALFAPEIVEIVNTLDENNEPLLYNITINLTNIGINSVGTYSNNGDHYVNNVNNVNNYVVKFNINNDSSEAEAGRAFLQRYLPTGTIISKLNFIYTTRKNQARPKQHKKRRKNG